MLLTTVTLSSASEEAARIEGAQKLGVEPDEITVVPTDEDTYDVSMMNAPGQFDIVLGGITCGTVSTLRSNCRDCCYLSKRRAMSVFGEVGQGASYEV